MFGLAKDVRSKVMECTPERFHQAIGSPVVSQVCATIKDAHEQYLRGEIGKEEFEHIKTEQKKRLPVFTPHAMFRNGRRLNAEAIPSGLSIYDKDHIRDPRGWWDSVAPRAGELGILLAHVTPSDEGCRLFFVVPQGCSLADAQAWMASQLGDTEYDACVKDYARCSFVVPREYILFMDEEKLFSTQPVMPFRAERSEAKNPGNTKETANVDTTEILRRVAPLDDNNSKNYPSTYEEIDYQTIVEVLEEQLGGKPALGGRNNFIFTMACHLRHICDDNPYWIAQVLPRYEEEYGRWWATIQSACKRHQSRDMPRILKRTLAICKKRYSDEELITQNSELENVPPKMPGNLPPLIKLLLSKTPDIYKPTVAHAVFPALATHLWQTRFLYIDNVEHEATLMNVLLAETGAGKSCITEPINRIMADIRERDAVNMAIENEWKIEMQSKGANKDKRKRPEGLVIQEVSPNMTNAAFCLRMKDANGRFLYALMNEIDMFDALKSSARDQSQFQIMCLAFDPNNIYGQVRVGVGAVNEKVCIRFNWNASATINKGQAYFRKVLVDGPISRINFCTIPERPIGSEMPRFGKYDEEFDEKLRPYIQCLNEARGLVECRQARKLAQKLVEEKAEEARLSQNRVYENLSFRANVIAFLKACVLYVAHGQKWSKAIEDFVRWSLDYDLYCKMRFFGKAIEDAEQMTHASAYLRGPQNLLDLLPDVFTRAEAGLVREQQGIRSGSLKQMLANWKHRGYIALNDEADGVPERQKYTKTQEYLNRNTHNSNT